MVVYRLFFDKDKEVEWLNQMAEKGWAMKHFFAGVFTFVRCEPGEYVYQVDFMNRFFGMDEEYKSIMEEMDVEIVEKWGFWVILRKKANTGEFVLYSDLSSRIDHYAKILRLFQVVTIIEMLCVLLEVFTYCSGKSLFAAACAFLLLAVVFLFANMTMRTRNKLAQLREEESGIPSTEKTPPHVMIPMGLLINSCGIIIRNDVSEGIGLAISIIAIVCMVYGTIKTLQRRNGRTV